MSDLKNYPEIFVFDNLNVAAFDEYGQQIPELQVSLASLFIEHMEKHGYKPDGCIIQTPLTKWKLFRTDDGWNRKAVFHED